MNINILTDDEVTDLARRIVTNEVYAAFTAEALESFSTYLMLLTGGLAEQGLDPALELGNVGLIYEDINAAGPLSVNGRPSFLSAKFVHRDDRLRVHRECLRMAEALGSIPAGTLAQWDADAAAAGRMGP